MDEAITVYITKYALINGIIKARGVIRHNKFFADNPKRLNMLMLAHGFKSTEFVLTESEARKIFEEKRLFAIKETEKRLEKLKTLQMQIKEY